MIITLCSTHNEREGRLQFMCDIGKKIDLFLVQLFIVPTGTITMLAVCAVR